MADSGELFFLVQAVCGGGVPNFREDMDTRESAR